MIQVTIPYHLQTLANVDSDVTVDVDGDTTIGGVLDALEHRFPMLRGTIRDHSTKQRRAFLRYFACGQDLSHEPIDTTLPEPVVSGAEPFMVVGAIAGG